MITIQVLRHIEEVILHYEKSQFIKMNMILKRIQKNK